MKVETDCVDFKYVTFPIRWLYTLLWRDATLWHVCIVPDECHDSTDGGGVKTGGRGRGRSIRYVSIKPLIWVSILLFNIYTHANKWTLCLFLFSFIIFFIIIVHVKSIKISHPPPPPPQLQTLQNPGLNTCCLTTISAVFYNYITVCLNFRCEKIYIFKHSVTSVFNSHKTQSTLHKNREDRSSTMSMLFQSFNSSPIISPVCSQMNCVVGALNVGFYCNFYI